MRPKQWVLCKQQEFLMCQPGQLNNWVTSSLVEGEVTEIQNGFISKGIVSDLCKFQLGGSPLMIPFFIIISSVAVCWKEKEGKLCPAPGGISAFIICDSKRAFWSLWKSQRLANQENWPRTGRTESTLPTRPASELRVVYYLVRNTRSTCTHVSRQLGGQRFEVLIKVQNKMYYPSFLIGPRKIEHQVSKKYPIRSWLFAHGVRLTWH